MERYQGSTGKFLAGGDPCTGIHHLADLDFFCIASSPAKGFELYETPLSGIPTVLQYGQLMDGLSEGICGTGDSFEMAHSATVYNVVDMEAYALALVAQKENIPFLCLKYISDGADGNAADDWSVQVHNAALAFKKILKLDTRG